MKIQPKDRTNFPPAAEKKAHPEVKSSYSDALARVISWPSVYNWITFFSGDCDSIQEAQKQINFHDSKRIMMEETTLLGLLKLQAHLFHEPK